MIISLIAALGRNGELGKDQKLLWHIPEDLKKFKQLTIGKPLLMGRKTFESIGRPLPKRLTIVLTQNKEFKVDSESVVVINQFKDFDDLFLRIKSLQRDFPEIDFSELIVAGGGEIYRLFLPLTQRMYLSAIDLEVEADTFFPDYSEQDWKCVTEDKNISQKNEVPWTFRVLERK